MTPQKAPEKKRLIVVAFGGNALHPENERGTQKEQMRNALRAAKHISTLFQKGYHILLVHGNGPQVGSILIQMEEASTKVPPFALDVAVAMSQGSMGYMIMTALQAVLNRRKIHVPVSCVLTRVLVDENDPAFLNPTKPIGPFFTAYRASRLMKLKRWTVIEDAGRGYRRVVPSPKPIDIIDLEAIRKLTDQGFLVIACGGGGIPVVKDEKGRIRGVEAVIDKDYTSALLAQKLNASMLLILTNVEKVAIYYRSPQEKWLDRITLSEVKRYYEAGHFPPGSMGPKIQAAIDFLEQGGEKVLITNIPSLRKALEGKTGTWIIPQ